MPGPPGALVASYAILALIVAFGVNVKLPNNTCVRVGGLLPFLARTFLTRVRVPEDRMEMHSSQALCLCVLCSQAQMTSMDLYEALRARGHTTTYSTFNTAMTRLATRGWVKATHGTRPVLYAITAAGRAALSDKITYYYKLGIATGQIPG